MLQNCSANTCRLVLQFWHFMTSLSILHQISFPLMTMGSLPLNALKLCFKIHGKLPRPTTRLYTPSDDIISLLPIQPRQQKIQFLRQPKPKLLLYASTTILQQKYLQWQSRQMPVDWHLFNDSIWLGLCKEKQIFTMQHHHPEKGRYNGHSMAVQGEW